MSQQVSGKITKSRQIQKPNWKTSDMIEQGKDQKLKRTCVLLKKKTDGNTNNLQFSAIVSLILLKYFKSDCIVPRRSTFHASLVSKDDDSSCRRAVCIVYEKFCTPS